MQWKIPLFSATLVLTTLLSTAFMPATYAIPGPPVADPANVWQPYGPRTARLQFNYYPNEASEFTDFELGLLDLTDWPVSLAKWTDYDNNPDFVLSAIQSEFGMFQLDINQEGSHWWGCDMDGGNSACGIEIRKALSHLVDRPRFTLDQLQGIADALFDPTPTAKLPSGSSLATQSSWDPGHATINAYNIASDAGGFPAAGSADMCGARDHVLAAGLGFTDNNNDCVIDNPGVAQSNPLRYMIRGDDPRRSALGTGHMNAINTLFGTDVVAETIGDINQLGDTVFVTGTTASPLADDWEIYTGGWSLGGPFPDHLRPLYGNSFASDFCLGGTAGDEPLNYDSICVPSFDENIDAATFTGQLAAFQSLTLEALDEFGSRALVIPAYSLNRRTAGLRDAGIGNGGLVNSKGFGYANSFWTLINMHNDPSYTPSNPAYTFGGGDDVSRWGQRQGTRRLNMFRATTLWDFNALGMMYDGLIALSPVEPFKIINWMASRMETTFDAEGDTHLRFTLRSGLQWHDGMPVTAEDVRFSMLNYRDIPAANLVGAVELLIDATVIDSRTVELEFQGQSVSHVLNSGSPIIPKHVWDTDNNGIADPDKTLSTSDAMAMGLLIGSGPYVCRSVFAADLGTLGTGCAQNADGSRAGQAIAPGGRLLLERFDYASAANPSYQYHRSYNTAWPAGGTQSGLYQEWSWADRNDNLVVDILDLIGVQSAQGTADAYWDRLGAANVGAQEINTVAAHRGDTWTDPFTWSSAALLNLTPFDSDGVP